MFDNTTIADRLRTVNWSNNSHPTDVVNLQCKVPTFLHVLPATVVQWKWHTFETSISRPRTNNLPCRRGNKKKYYTNVHGNKYYNKNIKWHPQEQALIRPNKLRSTDRRNPDLQSVLNPRGTNGLDKARHVVPTALLVLFFGKKLCTWLLGTMLWKNSAHDFSVKNLCQITYVSTCNNPGYWT